MGLADELDVGSIGFFWQIKAETPLDLGRTPDRGHVRTEGGWAIIETLEENAVAAWMRDDNEAEIEAVAASLATSSALFLEVQQHGFSRHIGGWQASSTKRRARTAISNVTLDRLRSTKLRSLQANFLGISEWAGITAASESFEMDERGRGRSWSIQVESPAPQRSRLFDRRMIVLEADWAATGPTDQRLVTTPVAIRCESRSPRPVWDLLGPLIGVQGLLSFMHGGFVPARDGNATLDLRGDPNGRDRARSPMWNGALMVASPAAPLPRPDSRPYFRLSALGGTAGLSRWVRLCVNHPRAVSPVLTVYRQGVPSPELGLLEAAAGIEYWIRANRKDSWADKANGPPAAALARHVGNAFKQWVGDASTWAEGFRSANNRLKHDPSYAYDRDELNDLAASGRLLLASALLNSVSGNQSPSRNIFTSGRVHALGFRLRRASF